MTFHKFGRPNLPLMILLQPSCLRWDVFESVIEKLKDEYHLLVPAFPGYDPDKPEDDFPGVEEVAGEIADYLVSQNRQEVEAIYGLSMGGSVVFRLLTDPRLHFCHVVIDAGISPYQMPYLLTRCAAVRDYVGIRIGKHLSPTILARLFSAQKFSQEDLQYLQTVLRGMSSRTIWNSFESCNNFSFPAVCPKTWDHMVYWYGEKERSKRTKELKFMTEHFPQIHRLCLQGMDHGDLLIVYPDLFVKMLINTLTINAPVFLDRRGRALPQSDEEIRAEDAIRTSSDSEQTGADT
ncbi:MAG: alpha/beta hydrolase [Clostridia bacterium]|nr:alpha/beta hydrolase [Clostridia bacterium]